MRDFIELRLKQLQLARMDNISKAIRDEYLALLDYLDKQEEQRRVLSQAELIHVCKEKVIMVKDGKLGPYVESDYYQNRP